MKRQSALPIRFKKILRDAVCLGAIIASGMAEDLWLTDEQRDRHVLITGTTGSGKTYGALLPIAAQDILRGYHGHCVIDPVGTLFLLLLAFLATLYRHLTLKAKTPYAAMNRRIIAARDALFAKIYILDFLDPDICGYRFNPLQMQDGLTSSALAGDMLRVIARVFDGDINQQRRMQLVARAAWSLIAEAGGTLLDASNLLCMEGDELRGTIERIVKRTEATGRKVRLEFVRDYMDRFYAETEGRERRELIQSNLNMLNALGLSDDRFRDFVSEPCGNLPLSKIVNEGGYLLVRIPDGLDLNTRMNIGSMLVNRIQTLCIRRTKEQRARKFSLIVDEAHLFFGEEWCQAISTVRNYGLNIIAAHQTEAQFRTHG